MNNPSQVAQRLGRRAIVIDRSGAYVQMTRDRLAQRELFAASTDFVQTRSE